jgi:cytochrome c oxidase cbb3-type subunit 1
VKATYPFYAIRLLGGLCFLSGMFVMAYNVLKTIQNKQFVDAPIPAANLAAAH